MLLLGLSIMTTSCSQNKLKGDEWLEGTWRSSTDSGLKIAKITPRFFQMVDDMSDEDMDIDNAPLGDYVIKIEHNEYLRSDVKAIYANEGNAYPSVYIDDEKQAIYWLYDFDIKVYFTKE